MKLCHSYLTLQSTKQGCLCRSHATFYRSMPAGVKHSRRSAGQAHKSKGHGKADELNSALEVHFGIQKQMYPHKAYADCKDTLQKWPNEP